MIEQSNPTLQPGANMRNALTALLIGVILFVSGCNGNAPSLDSSAQAWVEYPYEGDILPMGPVTLVVYAADPAGISFIQIKVNGQSQPAIQAASMTTDGSTRLVRVDQPWIPPGEGEYLIEAVGVNSAGASGGSGSTRFCIVTCTPTITSTPAPNQPPTDTPLPLITLPPLTPTITPTFTQSAPGITVNFFAEPSYVNAGNCSYLRWDVTGTDSVFLDGNYVYFRDNKQVCPCETETHILRVVAYDGTTQDYNATINVSGSCYVPPTTEVPPPPPSDTSGPTFNGVYAFWEGCSVYGQADIYDPSGVSWAEFWYNLNGQGWNWIQMNLSGGSWISQVGVPVSDGFNTPVGSLVYKVRTLDTLNNESWSSPTTLTYNGCGGNQ